MSIQSLDGRAAFDLHIIFFQAAKQEELLVIYPDILALSFNCLLCLLQPCNV